MSVCVQRPYDVIVTLSRDFQFRVEAASPREARERARELFAERARVDDGCSLGRVRLHFARPETERCPFTQEMFEPHSVEHCS